MFKIFNIRNTLLFFQIAFMLKYLEDHYGDRATQGDKTALEAIRTETTRLKDLSDQQKEKTAGTTDDDHKEPMGSEDETDEDVSFRFYID